MEEWYVVETIDEESFVDDDGIFTLQNGVWCEMYTEVTAYIPVTVH